jgi:hypothetical protein
MDDVHPEEGRTSMASGNEPEPRESADDDTAAGDVDRADLLDEAKVQTQHAETQTEHAELQSRHARMQTWLFIVSVILSAASLAISLVALLKVMS